MRDAHNEALTTAAAKMGVTVEQLRKHAAKLHADGTLDAPFAEQEPDDEAHRRAAATLACRPYVERQPARHIGYDDADGVLASAAVQMGVSVETLQAHANMLRDKEAEQPTAGHVDERGRGPGEIAPGIPRGTVIDIGPRKSVMVMSASGGRPTDEREPDVDDVALAAVAAEMGVPIEELWKHREELRRAEAGESGESDGRDVDDSSGAALSESNPSPWRREYPTRAAMLAAMELGVTD